SHGGCDFGDVTDLARKVRRHEIYIVCEVLPGSGHAGHFGLSTEFAVGADFAGDTGDFSGEGDELVGHRVDGVLEFENFAFDVVGDFAGEVAAGDSSGDFSNVSDLGREVTGHAVDTIC